LDYVEKQVDALTFEELSTYNYALAVIHKWLKLALEARRRDVGKRLLDERTKREDRDAKIEEEK